MSAAETEAPVLQQRQEAVVASPDFAGIVPREVEHTPGVVLRHGTYTLLMVVALLEPQPAGSGLWPVRR
jgi:hypothetical protein